MISMSKLHWGNCNEIISNLNADITRLRNQVNDNGSVIDSLRQDIKYMSEYNDQLLKMKCLPSHADQFIEEDELIKKLEAEIEHLKRECASHRKTENTPEEGADMMRALAGLSDECLSKPKKKRGKNANT